MEGYPSRLRGQFAKLIGRQRCMGSSPIPSANGRVAKWLNAVDCKSTPLGSAVRIRLLPPHTPVAQRIEATPF